MNGDLFAPSGVRPVENDKAARAEARAVLKRIVSRLGLKVAEAATGLADSHLSKALGENPGDRHLRDEHIDALLKIATNGEREDYFAERMAAYGYTTAHVAPRTLEARHRDLEEQVIRMFGQAGAALVDRERARP